MCSGSSCRLHQFLIFQWLMLGVRWCDMQVRHTHENRQQSDHLTSQYFLLPFLNSQHLHPEGKQSDIKLSLKTRCPQEALQISSALSYVGNQLIERAEALGMEYQRIRDVLQEHFKGLLERWKKWIAEGVALSTDVGGREKKNIQNQKAASMIKDWQPASSPVAPVR